MNIADLTHLPAAWTSYMTRIGRDVAFTEAFAGSIGIERPAAWPLHFPDLVALVFDNRPDDCSDSLLTPKAFGLLATTILVAVHLADAIASLPPEARHAV